MILRCYFLQIDHGFQILRVGPTIQYQPFRLKTAFSKKIVVQEDGNFKSMMNRPIYSYCIFIKLVL